MRDRRQRRIRNFYLTTTWRTRLLARVTLVAFGPIVALFWLIAGLLSISDLGRLLREAGEQLERYDW